MPTRALIWIVGAVVLAALIAALARQAGLLDRYFIFFPESEVLATPGDHGLAYEDVWLETRDGVRLHGWLVRPPASPGTVIDQLPQWGRPLPRRRSSCSAARWAPLLR